MAKDYYESLGVKKDASDDEIKKSYRKLAKVHHPDAGGDAEKFKEISTAYEHLSDPVKRAKFDQFGHAQPRQRQESYSYHRNRQAPSVGDNMTLLLKLTLEEIFTGVNKKFKYKRNDSCTTCDGHGGTESDTCTTCGGQGAIVREFSTPIGYVRQAMTCHVCNGIGVTYKNECNDCKGSGIKSIEEIIEVDVPSGVMDGMTFIMSGKGNSIKNGTSGDLHINIQELPHNTYIRNGSDLKLNLKLSYTQLVLGDKVNIDTIEGTKIRVTIPEHSDVGSNLRVQNKGLKTYGKNDRGDIVISLGINIPKTIDEETRELLNKLK